MPHPDSSIYSIDSIPAEEYAVFDAFIVSLFNKIDRESANKTYSAYGFEPYEDAFDEKILDPIKTALSQARPFSAVRIGDGETNFLAFGAYQGTPNRDRYAFAASITNQSDTFQVTETWMLVLRELMRKAVVSADMVGVLGLWRPWAPVVKVTDTEPIIEGCRKDPRGMMGHFRGIDLMLRWAAAGHLRSKIIAPAHFYFAMAMHLDQLVALTDRVVCITSNRNVVELLQQKFPDCRFDAIIVGRWNQMRGRAVAEPGFLAEVEAAMPQNMSGCLCLVGAGVWAEFYCTWAKQRGAVAVDIGSGYDLLAGKISRPVHRHLSQSQLSNLELTSRMAKSPLNGS